MEVKKSPKANLESKKTLFLEIGFVVALALLLFAFEWKAETAETSGFATTAEGVVEEEITPITQQQSTPPPPPPPAPKLTDLLNIVDNDQHVDDDLEITDAEDVSSNTVVDVKSFDYATEETGEEHIFTVVETEAKFPGNVNKWLSTHVNYPNLAQENGVQGKVILGFVIEKDGSITDIKVLRSVDASLDKEAIRVVQTMPKWSPGKQRGKAVRVAFTLPINFQLQN